MMMEQFEKFNEALDRLEGVLGGLKSENEALRREVAELKGIIEDRDLEILQLQEDAEKSAAACKAEKEEIGGTLDSLLGRMGRLAQLKEDAPSVG
ncbi:MAG: hypothetical protein Q4D58_04585 [Synergistaceae bacterium]|nr:hypothetical protein [Synergistaceae bacterium]